MSRRRRWLAVFGVVTILILLIAGAVGVALLIGNFFESVDPLSGDDFEIGGYAALGSCIAELARADVDWSALGGARGVSVVDKNAIVRGDDGSDRSAFPARWDFEGAWWTGDGKLLVLRLGPDIFDAEGSQEAPSSGVRDGDQDCCPDGLGGGAGSCFGLLTSTSAYLVIDVGKQSLRTLVLFPKFHDEVLEGNQLLSAAFDNVAGIDLAGGDDPDVISSVGARRVAMSAPTTAQVDPSRMSQIWVDHSELVYGARHAPDGAGTLWRLRVGESVQNLGPWAGDDFVDVSSYGTQALGVERDLFVCAIRSDTPVVYDSEAATLRRYPLPPEVAARGEVVATVAWLPDGSVVAATRPVPALEPGQDCPELDSNSDWVSTFRLDRASGTWAQDSTESEEVLRAIEWKMRPAG